MNELLFVCPSCLQTSKTITARVTEHGTRVYDAQGECVDQDFYDSEVICYVCEHCGKETYEPIVAEIDENTLVDLYDYETYQTVVDYKLIKKVASALHLVIGIKLLKGCNIRVRI